ncbi:integrase [Labrenzia sp. EL_13]|nr:integrase [Labrenzia sp. EL_13]
MAKEDRYLQLFRGRWRFYRRVPKSVQHLDARGVVQEALGTSSIETARIRRDALEEACNLYWASLVAGGGDQAEARYEAARARAKVLGHAYRRLDDLVQDAPLEEIVERIVALRGKDGPQLDVDAEALLGGVPSPRVRLSKAHDIFIEHCAAEELSGKSTNQIKQYKKVKLRAVNNFIKIVGDKTLDSITDEDAVRFHDWWQGRITGKSGGRKLSGNSGNRDIGNLRRIYREVYARFGERKRPNPFDGLSFQDPKRLRETPPPFPVSWIRDKLLVAGSYAAVKGKHRALNSQALGIFLTCIETGCRPSEICNIEPGRIHLDHEIPHIVVDFDESREIKTESSTRRIPLVGIALEAMKHARQGFPKYRDKENSFSAAMLKHLRRRELLPSERHIVYSIRHSFEDRLKAAHVDPEMRRLLMGHSIDRPEYGEGGDLSFRLELLKRIELPFDRRLLSLLGE